MAHEIKKLKPEDYCPELEQAIQSGAVRWSELSVIEKEMLIAEKIEGLTGFVKPSKAWGRNGKEELFHNGATTDEVPRYSRKMEDAWKLAVRFGISIAPGERGTAVAWANGVSREARTPADAICLAALALSGISIER